MRARLSQLLRPRSNSLQDSQKKTTAVTSEVAVRRDGLEELAERGAALNRRPAREAGLPLGAPQAPEGPASHGSKTSNACQQHEAKDVLLLRAGWRDIKTVQCMTLSFPRQVPARQPLGSLPLPRPCRRNTSRRGWIPAPMTAIRGDTTL